MREQKEQAKWETKRQAAHEAQVYENYIDRLLSVHKESPEIWDWNKIYNTPPPVPPDRSVQKESEALAKLNAYVPGFFDKLFGKAEKKRAALEQAVEYARTQDEYAYQKMYKEYCQRHEDWNERRQLAWNIMQGDLQSYIDALSDFNPFSDLGELGIDIDFSAKRPQSASVVLTLKNRELIPNEIKSLTATGKLSVKPMAKTRANEILGDFVCGAALRVGREVFAFLPVENVLVTIKANVLDSRTGREGISAILCVDLSRAAFKGLNFNRLDPQDAMSNFSNRFSFSKSSGFSAIELLEAAETSGRISRESQQSKTSISDTNQKLVCSRLEALLTPTEGEQSFYVLPASKAANLINIFEETKLTLGLGKRIADRIEAAGYCVEPDPRYGGISFDWNSSLSVFAPVPDEEIKPSAACIGASNLLKLCVLVAGADGRVEPEELGVFREVVQNQLSFSGTDLKRLKVLEAILVKDVSLVGKLLNRVAKAIAPDKRLLIGQVLVKVAAADGVITKGEFRALERVFKALGIQEQTLSDLIQQVCPAIEETKIQEANLAANGSEPLPPRTISAKTTRVGLDMAKVSAITNETKQVIALLSSVMDGEQDETAESKIVAGVDMDLVPDSAVVNGEGRPGFEGLDATYHPIVRQLLSKNEWSANEFRNIAAGYQLMPLKIFDTINEWADEKLGDYLLEGEDPILVRHELIRQSDN
jgi:uncharacterized tellurite resistance protein B-like protein